MFRVAFIFLLLCRVALGHVTTRVAELSTAKLTRTGTLTLGDNTPSPVLRYDSNGNLTNDGTRSFTYDAQEQLTSITVTNAAAGGSARTEFVYDGLGRRRIQRDYTIPGLGGTPVLHLNIGPGEGAGSIHIPIGGNNGPSMWE